MSILEPLRKDPLITGYRHVRFWFTWLVIGGLGTFISGGILFIADHSGNSGAGPVNSPVTVSVDVNHVMGRMPPSLFGTHSMTFDIKPIMYMNREGMYKDAYLRFGNQMEANWMREGFANGTFHAAISESIKGGAIPIVFLSNMPQQFSSLCNPIPSSKNGFRCMDRGVWRDYSDGFPGGPPPDWAKVHPKDYSAYSQFIRDIAGSLCRIGVRYFETGNEQDNREFWIDTLENYFATTESIIRGIKTGCPDAKMVLPATARETIDPPRNFIEQNLQQFRGKNWIDMVSWHSYYGSEHVWELSGRTSGFVKRVRGLLEKYGYPKDMPLIVDEWSYGWEKEKSATEIGAATIGRFVRLFVDENVRHTYHMDRDNPVDHASKYRFGSTGLLTMDGIVKPTYNVFRALKRLDATRISAVESDASFITALATKSSFRISVLVTNFENARGLAQQQTVTLSLKNLVPGTYRLEAYLIDEAHSNSCRLNKKTEPVPTTHECGISGLIDQKFKEAKRAAANAAESPFKQYLANLGPRGVSTIQNYDGRQIDYLWSQARLAIAGDQSVEQSASSIRSYCASQGLRPEQCVTGAIDAFEKSAAKTNYDFTLQQRVEAINNMAGVKLDKVTDAQISTAGTSLQTSFAMQPYSVVLAQFAFIKSASKHTVTRQPSSADLAATNPKPSSVGRPTEANRLRQLGQVSAGGVDAESRKNSNQ